MYQLEDVHFLVDEMVQNGYIIVRSQLGDQDPASLQHRFSHTHPPNLLHRRPIGPISFDLSLSWNARVPRLKACSVSAISLGAIL